MSRRRLKFCVLVPGDNDEGINLLFCLYRCLEQQPDNLTTIMALAVSYTNESMQSQVTLN